MEKIKYANIHDSDWLRQSFLLSHSLEKDKSPEAMDAAINFKVKVFSSASFKYADTSLGGNMVINPLPQFTKYADPPVPGLFRPQGIEDDEAGMGDFYSRAFDDNKRYITMTFGVPQFNSLTSFYKGFYNQHLSIAARTGRAPGFFFMAGQAAGFVIGLLSPWLVAYSVSSAFAKWASFSKSSKYYFFKPSMATYWNAVSTMANDIAVKTGFVSRVNFNGFLNKEINSPNDNRDNLTAENVKEINKGIDDLLDSYDPDTGESNGINVYAVATRYHRRQRAAFKALEDHYQNNSSPVDFGETVDDGGKVVLDIVSKAVSNPEIKNPKRSFAEYVKSWTAGSSPGAIPTGEQVGTEGTHWLNVPVDGVDAPTNAASGTEQTADAKLTSTLDLVSERSITEKAGNASAVSGWKNFLLAELDDGAQYVSFRVEPTGDASESFSSQAGEPEIASKINSASASARSTRFSMADGNIGEGMVASAVQGVMGAVKDIAAGAAQSLGLDGLAVLGGNAFADIPKYWTSSSTDMPQMSYRIKLISPYGNRYSKFTNIWLPFTMLLAAALPLSTGRHSYTSPFLCQLYDRGRAQTRLGMITQLSVSRGVTNLAFNKIGEPMAVEVNFTVSELSNIVHMPIKQGFRPIDDALETVFEQESLYNDYIATLSSMSLAEQIYVGERLKIGLTKYMKQFDSYWSMPHAFKWFGDLAPMRVASMFANGISNR